MSYTLVIIKASIVYTSTAENLIMHKWGPTKEKYANLSQTYKIMVTMVNSINTGYAWLHTGFMKAKLRNKTVVIHITNGLIGAYSVVDITNSLVCG